MRNLAEVVGQIAIDHLVRGPFPGMCSPVLPRPGPVSVRTAHVLDVLASPRFEPVTGRGRRDALDEGQYLCAERTMYRILAANQPVRERRNQRSHPCYTKPELVATGPNQPGPGISPGSGGPNVDVLLLYVLLDIFSRASWAGWLPIGRTPRSPRR